jgi:hypothetical protein
MSEVEKNDAYQAPLVMPGADLWWLPVDGPGTYYIVPASEVYWEGPNDCFRFDAPELMEGRVMHPNQRATLPPSPPRIIEEAEHEHQWVDATNLVGTPGRFCGECPILHWDEVLAIIEQQHVHSFQPVQARDSGNYCAGCDRFDWEAEDE